MMDAPRIRINTPNVLNFGNVIEHNFAKFEPYKLSFYQITTLKVRRSAIMDYFVTCCKLVYKFIVCDVGSKMSQIRF